MIGSRPGTGGAQPRTQEELLERSNLSTSQFLLWLGQILHPVSPLYDMVLTFDIAGPLDVRHFDRAFAALAASADALRTTVDVAGGIPRQRAGDATPVVQHVDLAGEPDADAALAAYVAAHARTTFDPTRSLVHTALLRLAPDRHVWFLNQHHLVTDGWATALVYRRVAELYHMSRTGQLEPPALPQYAAYVAYERDFRRTPLHDRVRAHWQRVIETPAPPVRLPGMDRGGSDTRTERLTLDLGAERSRRIRERAANLRIGALTGDAARFELFATALFAWLHRVSGQGRVAVGTPSHNRRNAVLKETIGPLIEIFPLTVDVASEDTFRTLLDRVHAETQQFLRYAQPGASSPALMRGFNIVLNYIHATFPAFDGLPMRSEWVHSGHGDSRHHLRLQVHDFDASGSFNLHFDFARDLLDAAQRGVAARHYLQVLDALLADPDRSIGDVDLRSGPERHRAPNGAAPAAAPASVLAMVQDQGARTPDAVALECGEQQLTYAQLLARARAIAARLTAAGAGREGRVGIHLERSTDAVVAILGTLMAGAAWVPLSPDDPIERTLFVLHDAGVRLLVTRAELEHRLGPNDARIVRIDDVGPHPDEAAPVAMPQPQDAAYVLYTSGSTGQPKGVIIEHDALARYVGWARDFYARGRALDMPLFTSLSFDLTLTSLFLPLVSGGRVVVYADQGGGGAATLLRVLDEDRVDAIKLTPSHLTLFAGQDRRDSRVRLLIVGGEDLKSALAAGARAALGEVEIFNEYGPTEATIGCMIHRYDPDRDDGASVPIGRAAGDARIYLLDGAYNPVPAGVVGEIFVAGPGVARGYLSRPDLTAERFLTDPLVMSGRMYRTGDRGCLRADGTMEFLGRTDGQLKVRGARVEPAEIEAALLAHPAIDACVVDLIDPLARRAAEDVYCVRCGLPSSYPGTTFDDEGVCHLCRGFDDYRERAARYFRPLDELRRLLDDARTHSRGAHDCVLLLSGGKDSTYALSRLVDMGMRVLAFTLDNGYLSEGAKANIRKVTESLGVDHIFGSTPAMNAIFVDSLKRHANVCNGCFKTIYTLGARLARERGIPVVITGLSRGQFFETRLTEELFRDDAPDVEHIDRVILEARKAYHRADDAVARLLDTGDFRADALFEDVRFVDFYRYCDVGLDEMLRHLAQRVPWIRPEDTGRSTNCLINDVGIFVHRRQRGYHNYAFPYSWDVRIGHKTREAALHELTDDQDAQAVGRILREIGYDGVEAEGDAGQTALAAFYVSRTPAAAHELRTHLARTLPAWMLPAQFIRVDALPLTPHGKVDRAALRASAASRSATAAPHAAPRTIAERRVASIWSEVLGMETIGIHDDFLELGGNSLVAIRVISRVNDAFGIELPLASAFEASTVASLAALVEEVVLRELGETEPLAAGGDAPSPADRG